MKTKKLLLVCMLSLFAGFQLVNAQCVNLIGTVEKGNAYFAAGDTWDPDGTYTYELKTGNVLEITMTDATTERWKAQFPITPTPALTIVPGESYKISVDVNSNTVTPFYLKAEVSEAVFLEIPAKTTEIGDNHFEYVMIAPAGLTTITNIIFALGGNPANTDVTISNISICQYTASDDIHSITVAPATKNLLTDDEFQFTATALTEAQVPVPDVEFTWSVEPNTATITDGLFKASAAGTYTVKASADGIDGTATVTVYEAFTCNNLLDEKTLAEGETYFAPGDIKNDHYEVTVKAGNEIDITLQDATWGTWQAQFPFTVTPEITITPGKLYKIAVNVTTNKTTPIYVKALLDDEKYLEIGGVNPLPTIEAGEHYMENLMIAGAELTSIQKILFVFGGNAADTKVTIKDITICTKDESDGYNEFTSTSSMSLIQSSNEIQIISEFDIKTMALYTIQGQSIATAQATNVINTSELANGVYLLNVLDVQGNKASFKVIVK